MPVVRYEELCASAISLLTSGDARGAAVAFQEILAKNDKIPLAWNNRGLALMQLGHPFDAITNIDRAIALEPNSAEYHCNRGAALYDLTEWEKAFESYSRAIELRPKFPEALMNSGNTLKSLGKLSESIGFYERAVEAKPDYVDAHLALSFALLASGDYEKGWKEFDWRWKSNQLPSRGLSIPGWNGQSLKGKTLLIYAEQGFGDALQFIRYAPLVKQKYGGNILVEVRHPLTRLAKTVEGIDGVITYGEKIPEDIDFAVPMMTLPKLLGTTVETIPWDGPYFKADPFRVEMWKKKLTALPDGLKVGICWAGMSRIGNLAAENIDRRRSTTLDSFSKTALVPGISWVSLQKGPPSSQVQTPPRGMTIGDWTEELDDFYDTAALIECLDLVITVDTSVVHLAGALNKPVWMLSRFDGCWRWLGDREDSPWYPSLRQFSQPSPGDWKTPVDKISQELRKLVIESRQRAA